MRPSFMDAREAAGMVGDGDTVVVCGAVRLNVPEALLRALGQRFREEGHPRDLTVISPGRAGWVADRPSGIEHLAQPGLVRRLVTSAFNARLAPGIVRMSLSGEIETQSLPMGTLFRWLREIGAGSPGLLTDVGLGTFIDPACPELGSPFILGHRTGRSLVTDVVIDGERHLFLPSMPVDVALVRGSIADTLGNISVEDEPVTGGVRHMALAAANSGGVVLTEVRRATTAGGIHPRLVEIPGVWVDAVVVDRSETADPPTDAAFTGRIRDPHPPLAALPDATRQVILRRVAAELAEGDVVNLGYGMATGLVPLAVQEGFADRLVFSIEHGTIGGWPGPDSVFGAHFNPEVILDQSEIFSYYEGGGLDAAVLGFAEIDGAGNVNNGVWGDAIRGVGGLVNIAHRTPKLIFCGTFTTRGLKQEIVADPAGRCRLVIHREGEIPKIVDRARQVNVNGRLATEAGQEVLVVTERAVFRVTPAGMELVEVAPGIDVETQILARTAAEIRVSPSLTEMDQAHFGGGPVALRPGRGRGRQEARRG